MKISPSKRAFAEIAIFTAGLVICLLLAFRLNFDDGKTKGAGVFYSDKSIYYVYLPATFIYGWDANKFPSRCDTLYRGFILDTVRGKVVNKMTYGVSLMWLPFWLTAHFIAVRSELKPDGFSDFYQQMAVIPPVFFLVLGLFFLRRFLLRYFPPWITWISVLVLFAGTNLYHYGLAEGLMSHVHSFFLFSLLLLLLKRFLDGGMRSFRLFAGISFTISLAILIRPSNVIILLWPFMLDTTSWKELINRLTVLLRPKFLLTFSIITFLVFLPQMVYWKYLSGHFLFYSYNREGFDNVANPAILQVLFSPLNGLFIYTPMVILFVAGFILMIIRKAANGFLLLLTFLLVSYISGSWFMWFFGGSLGSRPFVEYYALFSLGLGYFLTLVFRWKNWFAISLILILMTVFSWYNLSLTCYNPWNTHSAWAWDDFRDRLKNAGIMDYTRHSYTYIQDFENVSFEKGLLVTPVKSHSMYYSAIPEREEMKNLKSEMRNAKSEMRSLKSEMRSLKSEMRSLKSEMRSLKWEEGEIMLYERWMAGVLDGEVGKISVRLWVHAAYGAVPGELVVTIEDDKHHPWLVKRVALCGGVPGKNSWSEVTLSFNVPRWLNGKEDKVTFRLTGFGNRCFYLDDFEVKFE